MADHKETTSWALASADFWKDALERAVKTGAQVAVATIGTGAVGILQVDWLNLLSVTLMAMILSVLTSIASSGKTDTMGAASLVRSTDDAALAGQQLTAALRETGALPLGMTAGKRQIVATASGAVHESIASEGEPEPVAAPIEGEEPAPQAGEAL